MVVEASVVVGALVEVGAAVVVGAYLWLEGLRLLC